MKTSIQHECRVGIRTTSGVQSFQRDRDARAAVEALLRWQFLQCLDPFALQSFLPAPHPFPLVPASRATGEIDPRTEGVVTKKPVQVIDRLQAVGGFKPPIQKLQRARVASKNLPKRRYPGDFVAGVFPPRRMVKQLWIVLRIRTDKRFPKMPQIEVGGLCQLSSFPFGPLQDNGGRNRTRREFTTASRPESPASHSPWRRKLSSKATISVATASSGSSNTSKPG